MGNNQSEDEASSSSVEEFVVLAKEQGLAIENSILVMFRVALLCLVLWLTFQLHEASLDKEQWLALKGHILNDDFQPHNTVVTEKIVKIVSRDSGEGTDAL
jgi:hypothetical protein